MFKRILWLSFLCLFFCLLLMLMVQSPGETRPLPAIVQSFYALPAKAVFEQPDSHSGAVTAHKIEVQLTQNTGLVQRAPSHLAQDKPYHLHHYFAFHYSSEAG